MAQEFEGPVTIKGELSVDKGVLSPNASLPADAGLSVNKGNLLVEDGNIMVFKTEKFFEQSVVIEDTGNISPTGEISAGKKIRSAQLIVDEVLSRTSGPVVMRSGLDIKAEGANRDVTVSNGSVRALNVFVEGNLEAPFGDVKCVGTVTSNFVNARGPTGGQDPTFPAGQFHGKVNVTGDVTLSQGSVRALNVFVEGNLEAPFGDVKCGGTVTSNFVNARGPTGGQDRAFPAGQFHGNVNVGGNLSVTGDIRLENADCAEEFEVDATYAKSVTPGMVMVLGDEGRLRPSSSAYDKCVAGVVSGGGDYKPGIILGNRTAKADGIAVALLGRVACHVDATHESVEIGDLLTTSDTPGYAMKASDSARAFGAVIGKALRPLREGKALVPILVALQ